MARAMGSKKPISTTAAEEKEEFLCYCCGETKKKDSFYISTDPFNSVGVNPFCKLCVQKIARNYNERTKQYGEVTKASLCSALERIDLPYLERVWEASYNEVHDPTLKQPKTNIWSAYAKNIKMHQYDGLRWKDGDIFKKGEQVEKTDAENTNVVERQFSQEVNNEFEKNKSSVIRLLGYDPFEFEKIEDQPLLYSQLIGYLDAGGDSNDDMMRTSSAITIVRGFSQQAKIDDRIAKAMTSTNANTAELKTLLDAKKNLSATISQLAEQSCLSLKHNKNASKGENTWTGKIKKLRDMDFRDAEVNGFDIGTCRGMQQVLEISDASILKQLSLDESEWSDMVAEQRQMITKLQRQRDVYKEINRVLLRENLDLKDTLEENELLNVNNFSDLKDLFSPLAEIEMDENPSDDSNEPEEENQDE